MNRRTLRKNNTHSYQTLETRKMMAGDVSLSISNHGNTFDLHVDGDNQANQIAVSNGNGFVLIQGRNGTTIDGAPARRILMNSVGRQSRSLEDIHIDMEAGNDEVTMSGINANWTDADIDIDMGSGSDKVRLYNVSSIDDLMIEMGSDNGEDLVQLWNVAADDIVIDTGRGNDTVSNFQVVANDEFDIDTGRGNDTVSFYRTRADELDVDLGADDDTLIVQQVRANDVDFDGGSGFDVLRYKTGASLGYWMPNFNPLDVSDRFEVSGQLP